MQDNIDYDTYDMFEVPELDFNDNDDEEEVVCPCCHENVVSQEQIHCQIEGETCSLCNYHTWEEQ